MDQTVPLATWRTAHGLWMIYFYSYRFRYWGSRSPNTFFSLRTFKLRPGERNLTPHCNKIPKKDVHLFYRLLQCEHFESPLPSKFCLSHCWHGVEIRPCQISVYFLDIQKIVLIICFTVTNPVTCGYSAPCSCLEKRSASRAPLFEQKLAYKWKLFSELTGEEVSQHSDMAQNCISLFFERDTPPIPRAACCPLPLYPNVIMIFHRVFTFI
jgi:hypothetical protein